MILTDYDVQFWVGVTEIQENGKTESLPLCIWYRA